MHITPILAVIAIASLSACLNSSTGSEKELPATFEELQESSSDGLLESGEQLAIKYESLEPTSLEQIELQSGSAKYAGVAAFGDNANFDPGNGDIITATSAIELIADFDGSAITGTMANFYALDDSTDTLTSIDGILEITSGSITGNKFSADMSGNLTVDGVQVAAAGDINGGFFGSSVNAVEGEINGTLGEGTVDEVPLFGGFIAEIQY